MYNNIYILNVCMYNTMGEYSGINLPKELIDEVDKIILERQYGYKSRSEFIKESIRSHIRKILSESELF
jgi:metal-responsive CopG/Arc/MetJ family transcriptional regulator